MIFSMISSSSKTSSRHAFDSSIRANYSIVARISAYGLAGTLMLTGCSNAEQKNPVIDEPADQQVVEQSEADSSGDKVTAIDKDRASGGTEADHKPISYDVKNWEAYTKEPLGTDDLNQLRKIFGKVTVTDENSLDYASNSAVKYRFMKGEEPYLDIIDSEQFLEFGWYYANPSDSDSEKQMSIDHAKKAYKAATALMGNEGGQLITNILSGQIVKNKEINGHTVELAKCEFYSCMLILDKKG